MSRYCAKPTCSEFVNTWFELSREAQRVIRRNTPTKHAIGLCAAHAERFKVPVGWTFDAGDDAPKEVDAEKPWFFPNGTVPVESEATEGAVDNSATSVSQLDNTEEGTMLDRAFHGPREREGSESPPSKPDQLNDSSPSLERSATEEAEEDAAARHNTGEIPFPPHGSSVATV